jgi:hypothetical protein
VKPRVYIETTIPSYYYETRRTAAARAWRDVTRLWWDEFGLHYDLVTSTYVLLELDRAPARKGRQALQLLRDLPLLDEPEGFEDVVAYYIEHRLMPDDARGDAAHLALASMHSLDFVLTWNCRHLANANKVKHLTVLNARLALPVPVITTPLTLMGEDWP